MPNRLGWTCTLAICVLGLCAVPANAQGNRAKPVLIDYFRDIPSPIISYELNGNRQLGQDTDNITNSHHIAQQQVRLALNYLLTNRSTIMSGKSPIYNKFFGDFYNTDRNENPFLGLYPQTTRVAVLDHNPLTYNSSRFNIQSGDYLQFTGNQGSNVLDVEALITDGSPQNGTVDNPFRNLRVGDSIFIGDLRTGGEIHRILEIIGNDDQATIRLSGNLTQDFDDAQAYHVRRYEEQPNASHYNQVVNTLAAIRDALDEDTTYNGTFNLASFNDVFQSGSGTFPGLDELEQYFDQPIDRAFRQDGFSHSDTDAHLQNIRDRRLALTLMALLWTSDNSNIDSNGNTIDDSLRPYFHDLMTIFGDSDDPNSQNVGISFLQELVSYVGNFFDPDFIGSPNLVPTELQQWQMIVQSFAEYGPDLSANDIAAINLMKFQDEYFPAGSPYFLENRDAGNFAKFADLFSNTSEGGKIDPFTLEPFGKRAVSGFEPIVPDTAYTLDLTADSFGNGVETLQFNENVLPEQYQLLNTGF
ncbi:MAG: hypothetical protein O2955_10355 [Planctomycetota bacterium]|nr:hypothetical protein [Planctomycetota bacterium]MDA1212912.1 hypothetical protein [Planctomycetota bacterium]